MSANDLPRGPEEGAPERKTREKPSQEQTDWSGSFSAYLESHRASLVDSLRRLFGHPFGSFFTCLVMGITLSLPMGLSLLLNNVERLGGSWQRAAQISLFLDLKTSENQGQDLREQIERLPDVIEAQLISREQALSELQEQSGLGEALKEVRPGRGHPVLGAAGLFAELAERFGGQPFRAVRQRLRPAGRAAGRRPVAHRRRGAAWLGRRLAGRGPPPARAGAALRTGESRPVSGSL